MKKGAHMKKVKILDIATLASVSPTTISRYFNHPELISEKTRKKIEEVIEKTEYSQNLLAKSMVTGNSNLIGIILPSLNNSFYVELLHQLIEQGNANHFHFLVHFSQETVDSEYELVKNIISYQPKGLVLLSHTLPSELVEKFPIPVVSVERAGGNFKQINNDNFNGGQLVGKLLLRNECEVFIQINSNDNIDVPAHKRIIGFESTVKHKPYEIFIESILTDPYCNNSKIVMEQIVETLCQKYPNKKIGVFCSNDDIAKLLLNICLHKDISIPSEWEIVGYDGSPVSTSSAMPITSVGQNIPLIAQLILESLENYIVCESIVPANLIELATTKAKK